MLFFKYVLAAITLLLSQCFAEVLRSDLTKEEFRKANTRRDSRQADIIPPNPNLRKRPPPVDRILMGGGPTNPCPTIWEAMETHVSGFSEKATLDIMDDVVDGLRYAFQTRNNLTFPVTGSGVTGMATVFHNLVEAGDKVLVGVNSYWSSYAAQFAERLGAHVTTLEKPAGQVFSLRELRNAVKRTNPDVLYLVHGSSSTGALQPMNGIGNLCLECGCLLVVDVVATIASLQLLVDTWKIDAAFANSQKGLGSIVGLTPMTFSSRAWERYKRRKTVVADQYQDLEALGAYWTPLIPSLRSLKYSMAMQQLFGLREGLYLVAKETLPKTWSRVAQMSSQLTTQLGKLGLTPFVSNPRTRLVSTMTYNLPRKVNLTTLREFVLQKYDLSLGSGFFKTSANSLRIGLFACNAVPERVALVVKAVAEGVQKQQHGNV